jgi:hypothetical protein
VRDRDRLAHNPEVAGSNPVPATKRKRLPETSPGAAFMHVGNAFGNISLPNHLVVGFAARISPIADREACGGAVIVS